MRIVCWHGISYLIFSKVKYTILCYKHEKKYITKTNREKKYTKKENDTTKIIQIVLFC